MGTITTVTVTGVLYSDYDTIAPPGTTIAFGSTQILSHTDGSLIMPFVVTCEAEPLTGEIEVVLPATDDPAWAPQDWVYAVTVASGAYRTRYYVSIPYDAPGQELTLGEIPPLGQSHDGALYAPINHTHANVGLTGVYDVQDYGAIGNGSTDDTVSIMSAVAACETAGAGTVMFPPGTYLMSGEMRLSKPGIYVDGPGATLKSAPGYGGYLIGFHPANGVRMDGLKLSNLKLDCGAAANGIDAFAASYCDFNFLKIARFKDYGIQLHQDNLGGFGHHNVIDTCRIYLGTDSAGANGIGTGIYIWSSDENQVRGCTLESNGSGKPNAAQIFETSGLNAFTNNMFIANPNVESVEHIKTTGSRTIFLGNIFDGGTNAQVELSGDYCTFTGNTFYKPIHNSDCLLLNGRGNTIQCNSFTSATSNNDSRHAINASGASGINTRMGNTVATDGTWSGAIYNGSASQLIVATG